MSQFTLLASTKKGSKPDFHKSAGPDKGKELYTAFFKKVQDLYDHDKVKDGVFQAMMDVSLINDGPVGCSHIYLSDEEIAKRAKVTLEINTDPAPLDVSEEASSMPSKDTKT